MLKPVKAVARKESARNDHIRNRARVTNDHIQDHRNDQSPSRNPPIIQRKGFCPCDGGCPRCSAPIQAKLQIGKPGDTFKDQADQIADQVVHIPDQAVQRQPMEEEEEMLQPKPLPDQSTPIVQMQSQGQGNTQSSLNIQNFDADQTAEIEAAFEGAKSMASTAIRNLNEVIAGGFVRINKQNALNTTFGEATSDVVDRYTTIKDSALVTNTVTTNTSCGSNDEAYHFASGQIGANNMFICPDFFHDDCDKESTILHEAAHNAGLQHGSNNPVDEPWNYENYARLLLGKQRVGLSGVEEEVGADLGENYID